MPLGGRVPWLFLIIIDQMLRLKINCWSRLRLRFGFGDGYGVVHKWLNLTYWTSVDNIYCLLSVTKLNSLRKFLNFLKAFLISHSAKSVHRWWLSTVSLAGRTAWPCCLLIPSWPSITSSLHDTRHSPLAISACLSWSHPLLIPPIAPWCTLYALLTLLVLYLVSIICVYFSPHTRCMALRAPCTLSSKNPRC